MKVPQPSTTTDFSNNNAFIISEIQILKKMAIENDQAFRNLNLENELLKMEIKILKTQNEQNNQKTNATVNELKRLNELYLLLKSRWQDIIPSLDVQQKQQNLILEKLQDQNNETIKRVCQRSIQLEKENKINQKTTNEQKIIEQVYFKYYLFPYKLFL